MEIPGLADALNDPQMREKAEKQAEDLLAELKEKVGAEVRDIGVLRKEMRVTVPESIISAHIRRNYDEIMQDVVIPGFRKGRAPRQLIERRFAGEVRESLKTTIVGQGFFAAVENQKLEILGDPLFSVAAPEGVKLVDFNEALAHLKLPEKGDFSFTVELEVKPTFTLPELKGITIKRPQITIDDELVDEHLERQCKIRGRYEPTSAPAGDRDDVLIADVLLSTADGKEVKREANVQLGVRPTRLDGIPLPDLEQTLSGVRSGDTRSTDCTFPDDYERPDLRGQKGRFEFTIHEVKRLVPVDVKTLMQQLAIDSEAELRQHIRDELEAERARLVRRAESLQVLDYLLAHCTLDLPADLSARMTDRAVMRRVIELQQQGVPWSEIEAKIDELRASATEDVARDLKLEFILAKVADELEVRVTDEEVNTEIARLARTYNRRFDKVRDDLQQRGLLPQLAEQIRQDKCVALLLKDAQFVDVKPEEGAKPKGKTRAAKPKPAETAPEAQAVSPAAAEPPAQEAAAKPRAKRSTKKKESE